MKRLLEKIVARIRLWVYQAGFDPNPGTIFYSPSLTMSLAGRQAMLVMQQELEKNQTQYDEATRKVRKILDESKAPKGKHHLPGEDTVVLHLPKQRSASDTSSRLDQEVKDGLFMQVAYCPICASPLTRNMNDTKSCPRLHGMAYLTEDASGLPGIMFEFIEY